MPGIRAFASALAAVCAVGLPACGSDDEGTIPQENGQAMLAQLDDVEQAVEAQDCDTARSAAVGLTDQVDALPADVDPELRDALVEASNQLVALTQDPEQCTPVETGASDDLTEEEPDTTTEAPEEELPNEENPPTDEETPPADEEGNEGPGGGNSGSNGNSGSGSDFEGGEDSSGGGIGSEG
jgi:hypothetical protein